uniref:PIH1D1/2/3 CS-like domain-containing protein n=1 Tax=Ciona savignyi TaxID=51511 RepID=H2Y9S8_CIOSA
MMGMTITVLQTQQKILLSNYYKEIKDIFKGDLPANPRALFLQNPDSEFSDMGKLAEKCKANVKSPTDCLSSPESLLKNLSENPADTEEERTLDADFMKNLSQLNEPKDKKKNTKLIEEIAVPLDVPVHMLQEYESDDRNPHRFVLRVNLPDISSVEECDLEIFKDELELTVEKKYYLKLQLPKPILDEKTSARFVRKSNLLSVTMPLEHS